MRLRFSPRARSDIEQIFQYLDERSPSGARNVLQHIYIALRFIAEQPDASERTDNPNVRVKIVTRYRYKIFYTVGQGTVDVLHIRHAARRYWRSS
jgi:toxin ParE1/3/4